MENPQSSFNYKRRATPKAFIFDVFGTLVDWRTGVAAVCGETFNARSISFDPLEFADLWRAQYKPAMTRIRAGGRPYVSLDTLHRENLDEALKITGLEKHFTSDERDKLNHAWEQLPAWPEVPGALLALRRHGLIASCSNGSIALMTRLARFAGLPWDTVLGAEIARNYKPESVVYLATCEALGLAPSEVMMVAAHNDDLMAARATGLQTGFFPRRTEYGPNQTEDLEAESDWDFTGENLASLLAFLEH